MPVPWKLHYMPSWLPFAWWVSVGMVWAGYDEYMTCGSGNERYGRQFHHFPELPCDISRNSWCENAGTQYPWSAVRRFVYENQGLMKRMYGNQRHYNVLRAELLNDLYEDMFDEMPTRQHQYRHPSPPSARSARYQNPSNSNTLNSKTAKSDNKQRDHQNGRAMKVTIEPEYNSREQQVPTTTMPKSQSKASKTQGKTTTTDTNTRMSDTSGRITSSATTKSTRTTSRQTSTTGTTTSDPPTTFMDNVPTTTNNRWNEETEDGVEASLTREYLATVERDTQPTLLPPEQREEVDLFGDLWTTLSDSSTDSSSSSYTNPGSAETYSSYTYITVPETSTSESSTTHSGVLYDNLENDDGHFSEGFVSTPLDEDDLTTLTLSDRVDQEMKSNKDGVDFNKDEIDIGIEEALSGDGSVGGGLPNEEGVIYGEDDSVAESAGLQLELREQVFDELRVEGNVREEVKTESPEEPPRIKRPVRGINACPVKEEFVAPYWANNTRGETLALLNLYPFEQFVQWERCMYEHRQMYCRAGCRCEQQYRLHKLLAFDPTNECRGIFSDWFRFPSCCVCKCYDLPQDMFTMASSSRKPRVNQDEDEEEEYGVYFDDDDADSKEEEADSGDKRKHPPVKPGPPLANIPPQRRPRLPPRPHSHIAPPSPGLLPPPPSPNTLPVRSFSSSKPSSMQTIPTESPEVSTLGTVDVATPHYFFNISNYAHVLFAKGHPLPLSRVPRSPGV
ncbi:protein spaetzle 4-like isoform X1 [Homarus americanus]|uniref:protein spaetzle 4-like isoform X1 n=1 Tax=Homarus americanus TaxID=6706 RepID=UPI001C48ABD1|nr:protein spaetzle 4-like isoform X1 [Homarus americanus]